MARKIQKAAEMYLSVMLTMSGDLVPCEFPGPSQDLAEQRQEPSELMVQPPQFDLYCESVWRFDVRCQYWQYCLHSPYHGSVNSLF